MNSRETRCLSFLQSYFPNEKWEIKYKHPDIRNPSTGRSLELDLYCINLKLAIEYNGPQHYIPHFYNGNGGKLPAQMDRDFTKSKKCEELGITLIDIPNLNDGDVNIESFLEKHLTHRGFARQIAVVHEEKTTTTTLTTTTSFSTSYKICASCKEKKLVTEFYRDSQTKDGYATYCKVCRKNHRSAKKTANMPHKQEPKELSPEEKMIQCLASLNMDVDRLNEIYTAAIKIIEMQRNPSDNKLKMCVRDMVDTKYFRGIIQTWIKETAFVDNISIEFDSYAFELNETSEEITIRFDREYNGKQLQDLKKRLTRVYDLSFLKK